MERKEKIFSLHRYIDENGAPDYERIFSVKDEKPWERHLDLGLVKIWKNQPDLVKREVIKHLSKCEDCRARFKN